jgi:DNA polymerase-3 subunit delta
MKPPADNPAPAGAPPPAVPEPADPPPAGAYLLSGTDAGLLSEALSSLLGTLTASQFVPIEEHGAERPDDDIDLAPVLDALATPPFLADRRIVVLRDAERLDAAQGARLAARVNEPVPSTILVVVAAGRGLPPVLAKAIRAHGKVIDASPGQGRARTDWVADRLRQSRVRLDGSAARMLSQHLGEDVARLPPILDMLEAAYGAGGRIGARELEPFLGDSGNVPPWDLTDAIDAGDGGAAVVALHRMMNAGNRHPLQIIPSLHRHFGAMLRLDGAEVRSADEAAELLKMSAFPARKVLEQGRRLGHDRIARAIEVIATADADLRGRLGWPQELVMEVMVARLAQLGRSTAAPRSPARA